MMISDSGLLFWATCTPHFKMHSKMWQ